jgi:CRP-like cAMP-binding protein
MSKSKLIDFISESIVMQPKRVEEVADYFQPLQLKKGKFLLQSGQICNQFVFLESGFIRSFTLNLDGNEVTTNFYKPNQLAWEVASYFQRTPSEENFQALTDCVCWYSTFEELQTIFHTIPEFREFGRATLVKGYIDFKQRSLSMINQTAEQRYRTLLRTKPEIFQIAPLKQIASFLGITDTSLSRIRKKMMENGE